MKYRVVGLLAATCALSMALQPTAAGAKDCNALVAKQDKLLSDYEALHKKQVAIPEAKSCDGAALDLMKAQKKKMNQIIVVQKQMENGCKVTNKKASSFNGGKLDLLNQELDLCGLQNELESR
jgi:hypothetical protein